MGEIPREKIKAYALENAVKHGGTARKEAVLSSLFAEGLQKEQIKEYLGKIDEVIKEIGALSDEEKEKELKKLSKLIKKREKRSGLPPLKNAKKGEVITRFAPFPSGPLHIGNARTLILNDEYAKMYNGKMLLVIDDTIGSKDKPIQKEAYKLIPEGARYLKTKFSRVVKKSSRMKLYYQYAEKLIKSGHLYVCDCPIDKMRSLREKGVECSCRQYPPKIQMKRWKKMFKAKEGSMCARLKTDMQDKDPAFRDRVMFRISDQPHALLGKKYRVYPLLDFSWAIDDHFLKITHILRGMELAIETRVEKFIWDIFGWKHPEVIYNGLFEIKGIKISKSKGAKEIKSGKYIGWDDPRTWSIQSLERRGILAESIREFILKMGLKKTNTITPIEVLYSINRKNLNDSQRHFFIENPKKIRIENAPISIAKIPLHPSKNLGSRQCKTGNEFYISGLDFDLLKEGNFRLMYLFNFNIDSEKKARFISREPDPKINALPLHWLPAEEKSEKVRILMPDASYREGIGNPELRNLKVGTIVQFERFGFAKLNKKEKDFLEFWFAHN
ncbi:glutamate--tRNA ligase [Candidatus Pacearchaeota archaeon]|nr:MAG: glutamate--tRNA ligase [Candidatus Pacearchaeota archaeon]